MERIHNMGKRDLVVLAGVIGLLAGILFGYVLLPTVIKPVTPGSNTTALPISTLMDKTEKYLTDNFLSSYGATANIKNYTEIGDFVVFGIEISQNGETFPGGEVYVTKDGKTMFVGKYDLNEKLQPQNQTQEPAAQNLTKSDKPSVKLFVMAFCPYGQQAESAMWPVLNLLGDKINFELHFVIYPTTYYAGQEAQYCIGDYCSMHGTGDLKEDIRQMCVMKTYNKSVWLGYIQAITSNCSYSNVETCWKAVAVSAGVDGASVEKCLNESLSNFANSEQALDDAYGVQGSPALFINGAEYAGARSADAFKNAICSAFTSTSLPAECSNSLNSDVGTASGSCG